MLYISLVIMLFGAITVGIIQSWNDGLRGSSHYPAPTHSTKLERSELVMSAAIHWENAWRQTNLAAMRTDMLLENPQARVPRANRITAV